MKKMNYAGAIIDGYNAIAGAIVAVLSYILGEHWVLFVAFLLFERGRLDHWLDEKPHDKEREFCQRVARCPKEARILDHDYGSLWGKCNLH